MPSRISQMRSGQPMMQQQTPQLNQAYINQLKILMNSKNSMQLLTKLASTNPRVQQLFNLYQSGGNLQAIAQQMAQQNNIDLNGLINQLTEQ